LQQKNKKLFLIKGGLPSDPLPVLGNPNLSTKLEVDAASEVVVDAGLSVIEEGIRLLFSSRLLKRPLTDLEQLRVKALIRRLDAVTK
jgi:hypothetical protein